MSTVFAELQRQGGLVLISGEELADGQHHHQKQKGEHAVQRRSLAR